MCVYLPVDCCSSKPEHIEIEISYTQTHKHTQSHTHSLKHTHTNTHTNTHTHTQANADRRMPYIHACVYKYKY